jgi:hypothetical protein
MSKIKVSARDNMVHKTEAEISKDGEDCVSELLSVFKRKYGDYDFDSRLYALLNYSRAMRDYLVRVDNKEEMELTNIMIPLKLEIKHTKDIDELTLKLANDEEFMCHDKAGKNMAAISMYIAVRKVLQSIQSEA